MNLMVIGGGGREHALVAKLAQSPRVSRIYCAPGNGGTAQLATNLPIAATDIDAIVQAAKDHRVDFVVVAPDDPLAMGCVDRLRAAGIRAFGPTQAAARIESSKAFSKTLMRTYNIPTADFHIFDTLHAALAHVETCPLPTVIKADGLALGKGVIIAHDRDAARQAVRDMMENRVFRDAGSRVVIEEFMQGREVTWLVLTDGEHVLPLPASQDHKRALDGDLGPNTGGMGAFAPSPYFTPDLQAEAMQNIVLPTIAALQKEGCPFQGVLYFGLMLSPSGIRVVEYNARFGDPETQAILPLLDGDLLPLLEATVDGTLGGMAPVWKPESCACVVLASGGYPGKYAVEKVISGIEDALATGARVDHAGTIIDEDGRFRTAGGRVLGVSACGNTLKDAVDAAYRAVRRISFEGMHFRTDIGSR